MLRGKCFHSAIHHLRLLCSVCLQLHWPFSMINITRTLLVLLCALVLCQRHNMEVQRSAVLTLLTVQWPDYSFSCRSFLKISNNHLFLCCILTHILNLESDIFVNCYINSHAAGLDLTELSRRIKVSQEQTSERNIYRLIGRRVPVLCLVMMASITAFILLFYADLYCYANVSVTYLISVLLTGPVRSQQSEFSLASSGLLMWLCCWDSAQCFMTLLT